MTPSNDNKGYSAFCQKFQEYIQGGLRWANNIVNPLGVKVEINADYNFRGNGKRWVAAYQRRSGQIQNNIILIAFNLPLMYSEMQKRGISEDDYNIEAQARITLGHEVGHGLVDWVRLKTHGMKFKEGSLLHKVQRLKGHEEEEWVEKFGESFFSEATGVYDSELETAVEQLVTILDRQKQTT